ncbi:MAG: CDP-alcohol phosphatidyltransferase family protein [Thiotrichaceae bacterium]|nr:CDP-alcohol phosphatidyltransferase family protein [Thiotrichaceae bacterium]
MNNSIKHHVPNLISIVRILMTPLLLYLAIEQQAMIYMAVLLFSVFTDVLDGYLARKLNAVSELGSQLDSWGDFFVYSTMAISAWLLWPDIIVREQLYIIIIIFSFTIPVLVGLIKFKKLTSYHTISVKIAVAITILSYVLLFIDIVSWPVKVAVICCLYAGIEEILITLMSKKGKTVDVKSIWHVVKENRANREK